MITVNKLIKSCKYIVEKRKTKYINNYPYNLGYCHSDKTLSFDCWNLIKSVIWTNGDIAKNITVGKSANINYDTGLGDWTGEQMLNACTLKSDKWSAKTGEKINVGEFLLTGNLGHAGLYIGKVEAYNHIYNVVECNIIDGLNGVIYSYVDINSGKRYRYKGGNEWGAWTYHAIMPWVNYYNTTEKQKTYKSISAIVNGIIKGDFGTGSERKEKLYRYFQDLVNAKLKK